MKTRSKVIVGLSAVIVLCCGSLSGIVVVDSTLQSVGILHTVTSTPVAEVAEPPEQPAEIKTDVVTESLARIATAMNHSEIVNFIWNIANLIRDSFPKDNLTLGWQVASSNAKASAVNGAVPGDPVS